MTKQTREKIEQLRAELHELYKAEVKQHAKIDRISAKIRRLLESESDGGNIYRE